MARLTFRQLALGIIAAPLALAKRHMGLGSIAQQRATSARARTDEHLVVGVLLAVPLYF